MRRLACSALTVILATAPVAASPPWRSRPIRVAIDGDFAPYSFIESGRPRGYAPDYFARLAEHTGLRFQLVAFEDWSSLYDAARSRQVDVVATMVDRPERRREFVFTRPYIFKSMVIVTRTEARGIHRLEDLAGRRVAVVRGYNATRTLLELRPDVVPVMVDRLTQALRAVAEGKAEATVGYRAAVVWYRMRERIRGLRIAAYLQRIAGNESIAVRADWTALADLIQEGMERISIEEETALRRRWLAPAELGLDWRQLQQAALAATLALALLVLWALQARRKNRLLARERERLAATVSELETLRRGLERQVAERTRKFEHLSLHDELTGLGNRRHLRRLLEQCHDGAARERCSFAVLYLDLDRFKYINDTLGHTVGDGLLREVGARLREVVDRPEWVARFGGDEFTVVIPGGDAEVAKALAERILEALSRPFHAEGFLRLSVRASIGIALFPDHGTDPATLLQRADAAMYAAKSRHQGWAFPDEHIVGQTERIAQVEQMLLEAVRSLRHADPPFTLHYQPIVYFDPRTPPSFEALLRWPAAAELGVGPAEFIPLAEEIGLIEPIGRWVLDAAAAQAAAWRRTGFPFTRVSVNLSAVQVADEGLEIVLERTLAQRGCDPQWITLEITETALMHHPREAIERLGRLRKRGYRVAIDDFGTGASSLARLRELPAQAIKIDRSFIAQLPASEVDAAIVRGALTVAHAMGAGVTAEGVETEEQYAFLREAGCDAAQGWYLGRPQPPESWSAGTFRAAKS